MSRWIPNKKLYIVVEAGGDDTPLNFIDGRFVHEVFDKEYPLQTFTKKVARNLIAADRETAFNSGKDPRSLCLIPLKIHHNYMRRPRSQEEEQRVADSIEMLSETDSVLAGQLRVRNAATLDRLFSTDEISVISQMREHASRVMIFCENKLAGSIVPCIEVDEEDGSEWTPLNMLYGFQKAGQPGIDANEYTLQTFAPDHALKLIENQTRKLDQAGVMGFRFFTLPVS